MTVSRRAWALLLPAGAIAHPAAAQRPVITLPVGTLAQALNALARQSGTSVVIEDPALFSRTMPAVRTRTVEAAVRALARAIGADVRRAGASGWRLSIRRARVSDTTRKSPARMPTVVERGKQGPDADVIVMASKRGLSPMSYAGSVEVIDTPLLGTDAGSAALIMRSTILSSTYRGAGRDKLFVRGFADSTFAGSQQSVTGLYFGEVRLTYSSSNPDIQLYDTSSTEVLQGPQGTLYGSGSMGGIVRFNPVMPKRGVVAGSLGSGLSTVSQGALGADANAIVNLPLTGNLALRAVGYARDEPGFIDKPFARDVNRTQIRGGRLMARWWPSDSWTVDTIGMAQRISSRDAQTAAADEPHPTDRSTFRTPFDGDYAAAHLVVNGRIGDLALVSASGMASQGAEDRFKQEFSPEVVSGRRRSSLLTSEMRIGPTDRIDAGWIAGASYTRASSSITNRTFGLPFDRVEQTTETAVFGEASFRFSPSLTIGTGARLVHATNKARFSFPNIALAFPDPKDRREVWLLPSASLLFRPSPRLSAYLRYQQGRRPRSYSADFASEPSNASERIDVLDAGLRWVSEGGWHASASAQRSHWRHLRSDQLDLIVSGVDDLGDWLIWSKSAALAGPILGGLRFDGAVTTNRGRSLRDATLRLPDVAGLIARSGLDIACRLGRSAVLRTGGWIRYEGGSAASVQGMVGGRQGDYLLLALSLQLKISDKVIQFSVDNVLDSRGTRYLLGNPLLSTITPLRPRFIHLSFNQSF